MESDFIEAVSTSSPTPGGGGASAYAGALASALASMVGELTVGKPRYADVEDKVEGSLQRLSALREELLGLVDDDAVAFRSLAAAYRLPTGNDEQLQKKHQAMQQALRPATEVPVRIMRACEEVLDECLIMATCGSRMALSDAGACAAIARGALVAASMNVWINIKDIEDRYVADDFKTRAVCCLEIGLALADDIVSDVMEELGAPEIDFRRKV